jgi:DNA-binding XRE family transcriptional regulator
MTMQGKDLKELRAALGLTQEQFSAELGVSRKTINEWETDRGRIDRRSELAVRQVFNERSRLYGSHEVAQNHDDVPLAEATILWDRYGEVTPPVRVVGAGNDDDRYPSSYGACNADWHMADDIGRLLRLLARFVELTIEERIPAKEVHQAFSVIPEYRFALAEGFFKRGIVER